MSDRPTLAALVDRAEGLYRDYRLGSVREWKARTGGLAVGYMPIYIPCELLDAQGVLPVGLMGARDDLEIIRGDAYYQSYICHIPRSTIELGLNGSLDCLDGIIFPAICDVIRNLSGVWTMLFPDTYVRYLDVPQNFEPEVGGRFYRQELESLSADLAARGAKPYDPEALRASIARYNRHRQVVRELYDLRDTRPWTVPTSELYVMLRATQVLSVEEGTALLVDYRDAALAATDRQPMDQARVLLTGSFCEQPPIGLIRTLERAGCYIVDDDFVQISRWIKSDIPTGGDPLENLVLAFLSDAIASPTRYLAEGEKGGELCARVEARRAEGVIFCAPSFCDPALLDQPMMVAAVERRGVPWTAFKYSENTGQFQVIREQAGTFADSIKLWSGA
jgi:benzoyl-CoA reductase subunit C